MQGIGEVHAGFSSLQRLSDKAGAFQRDTWQTSEPAKGPAHFGVREAVDARAHRRYKKPAFGIDGQRSNLFAKTYQTIGHQMAPSVRKIDPEIRYEFVFSICTIVTSIDQYQNMIEAYVLQGFDGSDCEFAYIDNTVANQADAFQAFNIFLINSRAKYLIFCHQDIEPIDGKQKLIDKIEELTRLDPKWGLFGNAGANARGELQVRISDPHGIDTSKGGPFPSKVLTLDENFILLKRETNITLSRDIGGFHWYGFELCMVAEALGWTAYVVDFHVKHHSKGNPDPTYFHTAKAIAKKYSVFFRSRWIISPTKAQLYISSSPARSVIARISYKILGKKSR